MPFQYEQFGSVHIGSALSDFTVVQEGGAENLAPNEVRSAVGMIQVDEWAEGHREERTIDGVPVVIRREGWLVRVWGRGEPDPAFAPLPPPPGGPSERPKGGARVKIAPGYVVAEPEKPATEAPSAPHAPADATETPRAYSPTRAALRGLLRWLLRAALKRLGDSD